MIPNRLSVLSFTIALIKTVLSSSKFFRIYENNDDEEYHDENYEAQRYTANLEREVDEGYMRNSLIAKALHTTVVFLFFWWRKMSKILVYGREYSAC